MLKLGFGVCAAASLLAVLTLGSCGRSATEKSKGNEGQPAGQGGQGEPREQPIEGGSASGGGERSHPEGGFPGAGGAPAEAPCEPGARACDGPSVRVCDDDGAGTTIAEICSRSETCSEGECVAIACVPGKTFCSDGQILTCNEDGAAGQPLAKCAGDEFCIEQGGEAECSPTVCAPDAGLCLNQIATRCKADGSGPLPGGTDCTEAQQLCLEGECVDPSCVPGEKLCEHDDVYLCLGSGADAVLFTACAADEVCDPGLVACRDSICEPGKLGCDDTRLATCDALGLAWQQSGTDCAATNQICTLGTCKSVVCSPGSTFCQDGNVHLCDEPGVTSTLYEACTPASYHCEQYYYGATSRAYCTYNSCTPGTVVCNGSLLTTCNADGSGPVLGGTECGTDKVCSIDACRTKVCERYEYFCKNGNVFQCSYEGLDYGIAQNCGGDTRCAPNSNGYLECIPYDCTPGFKACLGNRVGTCADDGAALATVTKDCTATNQVCTSTTTCGSSAIDTLGAPEELQSLGADQFFGNVIDVQSNRQLIQLEANLVLAGTRNLRWVVFELVGSFYEARYDKVGPDQSGSGYLSSGPISYPLKAGTRYLLGVAVTGGGFVPYYDAKPWQPGLSFGRAAGSVSRPYVPSFYTYGPSDQVYEMRFTTELP